MSATRLSARLPPMRSTSSRRHPASMSSILEGTASTPKPMAARPCVSWLPNLRSSTSGCPPR
eukprot:905962-Pyramimonas_sp.AAC.1